MATTLIAQLLLSQVISKFIVSLLTREGRTRTRSLQHRINDGGRHDS